MVIFFTLPSSGQDVTKEELEKEIKPLITRLNSVKIENNRLRKEIMTLNARLVKAETKIDSLKILTNANTNAIHQTSGDLGLKIFTSENSTNQKIMAVDESLSKNSIYGISGVLVIAMLSGLVFWLLNKKQTNDKIDLTVQLNLTKSSIEESLVKEFAKQTGLMELQLNLIEQQKMSSLTTHSINPDHSLALKVADEITLIERNVSLMDSGTKGLKQLSRSVLKLRDNLAANGYEMPELLGKQLNRGMHSIPVSTIPDETLQAGVEIISKIIKPQVNFNEKMIQAAQIEVSVGY